MAWRASIAVNITAGKWAKALSVCEPWIAMLRQSHGNIHLPFAVSSSAWVLARTGEASEAETRIEQGNEFLDNHAAQVFCFLTGGLASLWVTPAFFSAASAMPGNLLCGQSNLLLPYAPHAIELLGQIATQAEEFDADAGEAHYRKALSSRNRAAYVLLLHTAIWASGRPIDVQARKSRLANT